MEETAGSKKWKIERTEVNSIKSASDEELRNHVLSRVGQVQSLLENSNFYDFTDLKRDEESGYPIRDILLELQARGYDISHEAQVLGVEVTQ